MIKRKGNWFYYYDSDKNLMGRMNIKTHEFVGDTSCMIKLYDHIMMIKKEIIILYNYYVKTGCYTYGICHALNPILHDFSPNTKRFIKSKFPKEYYDQLGRKIEDKKNSWRFSSGEKRKEFLDRLNEDYGITTTINETV